MRRPAAIRITLLRSRQTRGLYSLTKNLDLHSIDQLRRRTLLDRKHEELGRELEAQELTVPDFNAALDDDIGDDLLRLMFIACHPVLSSEARVAHSRMQRPLQGIGSESTGRDRAID